MHIYRPFARLFVCPVCKEAKADLAFLVDGSWSIGDDNFLKITRFLYSTMGSLDLVGPDGTQVSHETTPYVRKEELQIKNILTSLFPTFIITWGQILDLKSSECRLDHLTQTHVTLSVPGELLLTFMAASGSCV